MKKHIVAALVLLFGSALIGTASAQQNKPRVHEVNQRLKNQHNRVQKGVQNGALNKHQANRIHRQDRRINREKKRMMAQDGGHLTKGDQAKLNRQENGVSQEINRDETRNAAGGGAAPAPAPAPAPQQ